MAVGRKWRFRKNVRRYSDKSTSLTQIEKQGDVAEPWYSSVHSKIKNYGVADVLIGLSTSGNSKNVVKAIEKAKSIGMITVAFLGEHKGEMGKLADHVFQIPSDNTARIQELHITLGHVLCQELESRIFA